MLRLMVRASLTGALLLALFGFWRSQAADPPAKETPPAKGSAPAKESGTPTKSASQSLMLDDMDWMIGDWKADMGNSEVRVIGSWDDSKRYLLRKIYLYKDKRLSFSALQRFAYDPAGKLVRLWVFDWDGGFAEGRVTKQGEDWIVEAKGMDRNGKETTSKNRYTAITSKGFTLETSPQQKNVPAPANTTIKFVANEKIADVWDTLPSSNTQEVYDSEKEALLESPEWRELRRSWEQWFSVQKIYSPQEVNEFKAQFDSKVSKMNGSELRDLMQSMKDKIAVLLSKDAEEARTWLAQYMAVAVIHKDQFEKERPDVFHMTAQQLKEKLMQFDQKRVATRKESAAEAQGRAFQTQAAREEIQYQRQAHENMLNRLSEDYGGYNW